MWKRLRIAILLYVLAFIAIGQWLTARRTTSWESPLWINVYPIAGDDAVSTHNYVDNLPSMESTNSSASSRQKRGAME